MRAFASVSEGGRGVAMGITRARRLIQRRICRGAVIDITVPAIVGQSWAASVAASLTGPPARCRSAAGVALVPGSM